MESALQNYAYLWDGSQPGWALLASPEMVGGYCIFNSLRSTLLHIDDQGLNEALCKKMKESGCVVVEKLASSPVGVEALD